MTWESSNVAVASVDKGLVTALTVGETDIKVTSEEGGFSATCHVSTYIKEESDTYVPDTRCNSKVTTNAGRVAVMRGPVVYCVESRGLPGEVRNFLVDTDRLPELAPVPEGLPSDALALRLFGQLEQPDETEELYFVGKPRCTPCTALAIPYALWNNCGPTNMAVWLRTTGAGA